MCTEVGKRGKGKRREKKRKKEEKMGIKIVVFYKSTRSFFHMRSGHFSNIKLYRTVGKLYLVFKVSRSYPPLFATKILMVSQFGDL